MVIQVVMVNFVETHSTAMPPKRANISLPRACLKDMDKAELWLTNEELKLVRSEMKRLLAARALCMWMIHFRMTHRMRMRAMPNCEHMLSMSPVLNRVRRKLLSIS